MREALLSGQNAKQALYDLNGLKLSEFGPKVTPFQFTKLENREREGCYRQVINRALRDYYSFL